MQQPLPRSGSCTERGARVVDLSADFRLTSLATYERWYGVHPRPDLLAEAVYGLTELHRAQIARAAIVATPGCYPTASVLALAPLARAGLIADLVIDAKQGISGAGRAFDETTHLSMAGENIVPYNVAAHRHTPEIEEQLAALTPQRPAAAATGAGGAAAQAARLVAGTVARAAWRCSSRRTSSRSTRASSSAATSTPTRPVSPSELAELFATAYDDEPFVEVVDALPGVREVRETNYCRIFAAADGAHGQAARCSRRSTISGREPPRRPSRT